MYGELETHRAAIVQEIEAEERQFASTLERALRAILQDLGQQRAAFRTERFGDALLYDGRRFLRDRIDSSGGSHASDAAYTRRPQRFLAGGLYGVVRCRLSDVS